MAIISQSEFGFLEQIYPPNPIHYLVDEVEMPLLDALEPACYDSDFETGSNAKKTKRNSNNLLSKFICGTGNYPKKEYVRCKLIRGHKRAIRNAFLGKKAKKTINRINLKNKKQIAKLNEFSTHAYKNRFFLEEVSKPENGPKTDGISKKSLANFKGSEKSFNNNYCRKYFLNYLTRESFKLYCDVLFGGSSLNDLCDKFDFNCCSSKSNHNDECYEKWKCLETYLKFDLMSELGILSDFVSSFLQLDGSLGCEFSNKSFSL